MIWKQVNSSALKYKSVWICYLIEVNNFGLRLDIDIERFINRYSHIYIYICIVYRVAIWCIIFKDKQICNVFRIGIILDSSHTKIFRFISVFFSFKWKIHQLITKVHSEYTNLDGSKKGLISLSQYSWSGVWFGKKIGVPQEKFFGENMHILSQVCMI